MVTQEELKELLKYDPSTGTFTWLKAKRQSFVGRIAGSKGSGGYIVIKPGNYPLRGAHRWAWLYMTGEWPTNDIDHINGIRDDNRWANLRLATRSQNLQNRRHKSTEFAGAYFHKGMNKWYSVIAKDYKRFYLGTYDTPQEASAAYAGAKKVLHTFNPTVVTR